MHSHGHFRGGSFRYSVGFLAGRSSFVVASAFAAAIQNEIDVFKLTSTLPPGWTEPKIAVQFGQEGKFSPGDPQEQNRAIMREFNSTEAAAVDAVIGHFYSTRSAQDIDNNSYNWFFNRLESWRNNPLFGQDLETIVTEWNIKNDSQAAFGLQRAPTLVSMFIEMVENGVDGAWVWPLQQNTPNALGGNEGSPRETFSSETFRLLSQTLPNANYIGRIEQNGVLYYLFERDGSRILLISSTTNSTNNVNVDLASLGFRSTSLQVTEINALGGDFANDQSRVIVTTDTQRSSDGRLPVSVSPFEVMVIQEPRSGTAPAGSLNRLVGIDLAENFVGSTASEEILAAGGNDTVSAGGGNDTVYGGNGNDRIDGGTGNDLIYGGDGNDTLSSSAGLNLIYGDAGDDQLTGGTANDALYGGDGNDNLIGGQGNDSLFGGTGADILAGGVGNDSLSGGNANDTLTGNDGNDSLYGDDGNDSLDGGSGNDQIWGGSGRDRILGGSGRDLIYGDGADDALFGGADSDTLFGGGGSDRLNGDQGNDVLYGGAGADTFVFTSLLRREYDRIMDFEQGIDRIAFSASLRFSDLSFAQVSGGVEIGVRGHTVFVAGQSASQMGPSDFLFI